MLLPRLFLCAVLTLMIAGCGTTRSDLFSGLDSLSNQLQCPPPPGRLTEDVPAPVFSDDDNWVSWADTLLDWGADQAKRRHDLTVWYHEHCKGT